MSEKIRVTASSVLWERAVDTLGQERQDIEGRPLSRFHGAWSWYDVGFGSRASAYVDRPTAEAILRYFDTLGSLDGSGMDPDGAAETRREAKAARSAAESIRRALTAPQVAPTLASPGTSPDHSKGDRSMATTKELDNTPKGKANRTKWARERTERSIERLEKNLEAAETPKDRKSIQAALTEARKELKIRQHHEAEAKAEYDASKAKPKAEASEEVPTEG